jgi:hypothetical protein
MGFEPTTSCLASTRATSTPHSHCQHMSSSQCPSQESNLILSFTKRVLHLGATGALAGRRRIERRCSDLESKLIPDRCPSRCPLPTRPPSHQTTTGREIFSRQPVRYHHYGCLLRAGAPLELIGATGGDKTRDMPARAQIRRFERFPARR